MLKVFFAVVSLSVCMGLAAQSTVSGYVYVDNNNNGVFDKREKGIGGVAVSNGKEVVLTNQKGHYQLPVDNDNIIFVVKPTGYRFRNDAHNLPEFYRIHKPQGSPSSFQYKGVEPTPPLPKSLNFALYPQNEASDFSVLVLGDPQPYNQDELDFFSRGIINDITPSSGAAFGISLGDIVGDNLNLHQPYKEIVAKLNRTWYNVMGNHDMNYEADTDVLSDETFEKNFGPNNYSWNYGNAHFIILDNILYPDPRDGKGYWGGLRPDQIAFLKNNLQHVDKNKLIVVAFHIPFSNEGGGAIRPDDRKALFDLLKDYENCLLLSAHTHYQKQVYYNQADGWLGKKPLHEYNVGTTSGDWYSGELNQEGVPDGTMRDGTPRGYAFLNISDNRYNLRYKVAGRDSSYQIAIYAPKIVVRNSRGRAPFYANFFMGYKTDKVEYRIGNGKWTKMQHQPGFDYNYLLKVMKYDQTETVISGRRPSAPTSSDHIWAGVIDKNLAPGRHTIYVRAKDRLGNVFLQQQVYTVQ